MILIRLFLLNLDEVLYWGSIKSKIKRGFIDLFTKTYICYLFNHSMSMAYYWPTEPGNRKLHFHPFHLHKKENKSLSLQCEHLCLHIRDKSRLQLFHFEVLCSIIYLKNWIDVWILNCNLSCKTNLLQSSPALGVSGHVSMLEAVRVFLHVSHVSPHSGHSVL